MSDDPRASPQGGARYFDVRGNWSVALSFCAMTFGAIWWTADANSRAAERTEQVRATLSEVRAENRSQAEAITKLSSDADATRQRLVDLLEGQRRGLERERTERQTDMAELRRLLMSRGLPQRATPLPLPESDIREAAATLAVVPVSAAPP